MPYNTQAHIETKWTKAGAQSTVGQRKTIMAVVDAVHIAPFSQLIGYLLSSKLYSQQGSGEPAIWDDLSH